jgi:hypothetical protein
VSTKQAAKPAYTAEQQKACASVIEENFQQWCTMAGAKNGKLSLAEIGKLLELPNLPFNQAAALAAIARYLYALEGEHDVHKFYYVTQNKIVNVVKDPSNNGSSGRDKDAAQLIANYQTAYENLLSDMQNGTWSLYGTTPGPNGSPPGPTSSTNIQWKLNDCYLISAINGLLNTHDGAQTLMNMIQQKGNTFVVTFPGYSTPITVTLTPGEVAQFSYSKGGGCYLAVLGMATVQVMNATSKTGDKNPAGNKTPFGALIDTHTFGWVQKNTFQLLTGQPFTQIQLKNYTEQQWQTLIQTALGNNELVGTDYGQDQHFLTIINTEMVNGQLCVVIKNPWGTTRPFEGHEGPDGIFTIPLADMVSSKFGSITIQTSDLKLVTAGQSSAGASTASSAGASQANAPSSPSSSSIKTANQIVASAPNAQGTINGSEAAANHAVSTNASGADEQNLVELKLGQGSSFVAHNKNVRVSTESANVSIAPKAVAYIMHIGKDLAVYNICSKHTGDVKVTLPNKKDLVVPEGHELLLTSNSNASFEQNNLCPQISATNVTSKGDVGGATAFDAQFSVTDALDASPAISQLVNSSDKEQQKLAQEILKSAAAHSTAGN